MAATVRILIGGCGEGAFNVVMDHRVEQSGLGVAWVVQGRKRTSREPRISSRRTRATAARSPVSHVGISKRQQPSTAGRIQASALRAAREHGPFGEDRTRRSVHLEEGRQAGPCVIAGNQVSMDQERLGQGSWPPGRQRRSVLPSG